jgi:hypothetical protein
MVNETRQAGDLGAGGEEAARLRFNTQNDAFNYAAQIVERGRQWAIAQGVRTPREDYLEAQCEILIHMQFIAGPQPRDFYLVMKIIPFIHDEFEGSARDRVDNSLHERGSVLKADPNYSLVRRSGHTTHRPQNTITVLFKVWLKPQAEIYESLIDLLHFLLISASRFTRSRPKGKKMFFALPRPRATAASQNA